MNFEQDFRALLLDCAPLVALVGQRINWEELPEAGELPRVTIWNVTRDSLRTMDAPSGLVTPYLQLDCWATTAAEAATVADVVTAYLEGIKHQDEGTTNFQGAFLEGRRGSREPTQGAPAARYARVSLDWTVRAGTA
jgi:hypothetical protein